MMLAICMIFLFIDTVLALGGMENNLLNQKNTAALQAQITAFNSAEAGLVAAQVQLSGEQVNLSAIKGVLDYRIIADEIDSCQQHIVTIDSTAVYQNAQVKLTAAYLQARQPPLPGCTALSHRLWWRQ